MSGVSIATGVSSLDVLSQSAAALVVEAAGLPKLPQTAVTLGDSRTAAGEDANSYKDRGWFQWLNILLGQRLDLLYNAGVSGDTTSQMLARVDSDVLAYNPGWVFHYGFVNDIQRAANDGSVSFADGVIENLEQIYARSRSLGAKLVVLSETPSTLAYNTAAKREQANYIMNWQRQYCARTPGCYFIDVYSPLLDITSATGAGFSGYSYDDLHPTGQGARKIADACFAVLDSVIPKGYRNSTSLVDLCTSINPYGNILANGCMGGSAANNTGTNVSGNMATSWNNRLESGTVTSCVAAKEARTDINGGSWNTQTVVASSNNAVVRMDQLVAALPAGVAVGDTVFGACDVVLEITSGNIDWCTLSVQFRDASNVQTGLHYALEGADNVLSAFSGRQRTKDVVIPANTTNVFFMLRTRGNNGAQFKVKLGNAELRKVRSL